jgi:hypothetical protein
MKKSYTKDLCYHPFKLKKSLKMWGSLFTKIHVPHVNQLRSMQLNFELQTFMRFSCDLYYFRWENYVEISTWWVVFRICLKLRKVASAYLGAATLCPITFILQIDCPDNVFTLYLVRTNVFRFFKGTFSPEIGFSLIV